MTRCDAWLSHPTDQVHPHPAMSTVSSAPSVQAENHRSHCDPRPLPVLSQLRAPRPRVCAAGAGPRPPQDWELGWPWWFIRLQCVSTQAAGPETAGYAPSLVLLKASFPSPFRTLHTVMGYWGHVSSLACCAHGRLPDGTTLPEVHAQNSRTTFLRRPLWTDMRTSPSSEHLTALCVHASDD